MLGRGDPSPMQWVESTVLPTATSLQHNAREGSFGTCLHGPWPSSGHRFVYPGINLSSMATVLELVRHHDQPRASFYGSEWSPKPDFCRKRSSIAISPPGKVKTSVLSSRISPKLDVSRENLRRSRA